MESKNIGPRMSFVMTTQWWYSSSRDSSRVEVELHAIFSSETLVVRSFITATEFGLVGLSCCVTELSTVGMEGLLNFSGRVPFRSPSHTVLYAKECRRKSFLAQTVDAEKCRAVSGNVCRLPVALFNVQAIIAKLIAETGTEKWDQVARGRANYLFMCIYIYTESRGLCRLCNHRVCIND